MDERDNAPGLKQILGAMLWVAPQPLTLSEIRRALEQAAEQKDGVAVALAQATDDDVQQALDELRADLDERRLGLKLVEVARGYRLENDPACGLWLRALLDRGRPSRLSQPALETLAIIAYRQPCTRAQIEAVRGVSVDEVVRRLLELQLVRIAGRSDLPCRPWLYATTRRFLEHFGLKDVQDLPGVDELRRLEHQAQSKASAGPAAEADASGETDTDVNDENEGSE